MAEPIIKRQILSKEEALKLIQQATVKPGISVQKKKQLFALYQNINGAKTLTYDLSNAVKQVTK